MKLLNIHNSVSGLIKTYLRAQRDQCVSISSGFLFQPAPSFVRSPLRRSCMSLAPMLPVKFIRPSIGHDTLATIPQQRRNNKVRYTVEPPVSNHTKCKD